MIFKISPLLLLSSSVCHGFVQVTSDRVALRSQTSSSLFARSRKDMLREIAGQESVASPKKIKNNKKKSSSAKPTTSSMKGGPVISADLAEWAGKVDSTDSSQVSKRSKTTGMKEKEDKKARQSQRRAEEEKNMKQATAIIETLEEIFAEEKRDINLILSKLQELCSLGGTGLRQISAAPSRVDFRMVWAGSDASVCHIGTGLHKVPLARLQEIFMTIGKNRIEINEVIRILGPFPNVKNILKGDTTSDSNLLKIKYTSMIDGTGKEILAGKDENERIVDLDVVYASSAAIICNIPGETAFENNGSSLLVFFKEGDINAELEKLRVL